MVLFYQDTFAIKFFGIELSTGSLGHALPVSVGIALGLKLKKAIAKFIV